MSRENWLCGGDKNSKIFHQSVFIKRHRNKIRTLDTDIGEELTDPKEINSHIRNYFFSLFKTDKICSQRVSEEYDSINLVKRATNRKVRRIVFSMCALKAARVDDFHPLFY